MANLNFFSDFTVLYVATIAGGAIGGVVVILGIIVLTVIIIAMVIKCKGN